MVRRLVGKDVHRTGGEKGLGGELMEELVEIVGFVEVG